MAAHFCIAAMHSSSRPCSQSMPVMRRKSESSSSLALSATLLSSPLNLVHPAINRCSVFGSDAATALEERMLSLPVAASREMDATRRTDCTCDIHSCTLSAAASSSSPIFQKASMFCLNFFAFFFCAAEGAFFNSGASIVCGSCCSFVCAVAGCFFLPYYYAHGFRFALCFCLWLWLLSLICLLVAFVLVFVFVFVLVLVLVFVFVFVLPELFIVEGIR